MQELLGTLMWVALGSAFGGMARFFLSGFVGRRIGETFPWGTTVVNVTGAFAIGLFAAAADGKLLFDTPAAWTFVITGFLGSYTTVSSFSLQTLTLARDGDWLQAGGNVLLSVVLCLCAVAAGFAIGASTFGGGIL
ncbi:fluoride efflux transporter CrcB [Mesorhizobium sp. WSM2239]|uniref:Fluoride-specific ion channel FluC n=2 Tax=unclassified Mesorhizobium TaxID=325217 RepID=A0AAU8DHF9_9HYPH